MVGHVLIGGMKAIDVVQMIKAVLLILGAGIMTIWVLAMVGFNMSELLGKAMETTAAQGSEVNLLAPMERYKDPRRPRLDGHRPRPGSLGLLHVLMRFTPSRRRRRPAAR